MKRILPVFSYVFHPLFISVYATLFYFFIASNYFFQHEVYLIFIQVLILTVLLPISMYYLLNSLGLLKSKMLLDKKERRLPLAFHAILLLVLIKHSFSVYVIPELYYYFLGYLISTTIALLLVMFHYKASLHIMGIASLVTFIISISLYYDVQLIPLIAFGIICTGFTASSRLQMKAHEHHELLIGLLLGIIPQIALWFIWLMPAL